MKYREASKKLKGLVVMNYRAVGQVRIEFGTTLKTEGLHRFPIGVPKI